MSYLRYSEYNEYAKHAGCDYKDSRLAQEVQKILAGYNWWLNIRSLFGKNYYSDRNFGGENGIYNEIERLDKNLRVKEEHTKILRQLVDKNFSERVNQLKREKKLLGVQLFKLCKFADEYQRGNAARTRQRNFAGQAGTRRD